MAISRNCSGGNDRAERSCLAADPDVCTGFGPDQARRNASLRCRAAPCRTLDQLIPERRHRRGRGGGERAAPDPGQARHRDTATGRLCSFSGSAGQGRGAGAWWPVHAGGQESRADRHRPVRRGLGGCRQGHRVYRLGRAWPWPHLHGHPKDRLVHSVGRTSHDPDRQCATGDNPHHGGRRRREPLKRGHPHLHCGRVRTMAMGCMVITGSSC